jgi:hypothetical protein
MVYGMFSGQGFGGGTLIAKKHLLAVPSPCGLIIGHRCGEKLMTWNLNTQSNI